MAFKPFNDALGQRIWETVSAEAWKQWIEHSKKIVNEYRLDLTTKKAHDVLKEQCAAFLFGEGAVNTPAEYVPVAGGDDHGHGHGHDHGHGHGHNH
jgi:Fe-S cluster biosynthesis and repair protein YggX